jgi:4-hydroxy-3-methylbut-2-enyl diphosphate reductase
LTQTTLSISEKDELEKYIFHEINQIEKPSVSDICYATTNRQMAVQKMIDEKTIDLLIIV